MQDRNNAPSANLHFNDSASALKRIGGHLLEAGLLTSDQINVILNDQQATGMRFGDIAVARGWLKEQTVEWVITKVVEPERLAVQKQAEHRLAQQRLAEQRRAEQKRAEQARQAALRSAASAGSPQSAKASEPLTGVNQPPTRMPQTSPIPLRSLGQTNEPNHHASSSRSFVRRDAPIAKPLPSVRSSDEDVNWVG